MIDLSLDAKSTYLGEHLFQIGFADTRCQTTDEKSDWVEIHCSVVEYKIICKAVHQVKFSGISEREPGGI